MKQYNVSTQHFLIATDLYILLYLSKNIQHLVPTDYH